MSLLLGSKKVFSFALSFKNNLFAKIKTNNSIKKTKKTCLRSDVIKHAVKNKLQSLSGLLQMDMQKDRCYTQLRLWDIFLHFTLIVSPSDE